MSAVDLDDLRSYLSISGNEQNADLQKALDSAEAAITNRVGPLEPTQRTEWLPPASSLVLRTSAPIVSLDSVTGDDGSTVEVSTLTLDSDAGVVYVKSYLSRPRYAVTYTAGWVTLPDDLFRAVCELTRHFYGPQRGKAAARSSTQAPPTQQSMAYSLPNRVLELLRPYMVPRVA